MTPSPPLADPAPPHTLLDDAQAVVTAVILVSLGLTLLKDAGLVTGGTAGLAFLLCYATGWPLGLTLFLVNLPFYGLAVKALGWRFALKTTLSVVALSFGVEMVRAALSVRGIDPAYAAFSGGILIGAGLLVLFRHHASLGGVNVLALVLHKRFGWSAGGVQMVVDAAILAGAFAMLGPLKALLSLAGGIVVNAVLMLNHRPGRYRPAP